MSGSDPLQHIEYVIKFRTVCQCHLGGSLQNSTVCHGVRKWQIKLDHIRAVVKDDIEPFFGFAHTGCSTAIADDQSAGIILEDFFYEVHFCLFSL